MEIWPDVESILSRDASELFSEIWSHWVDIQVNFETLCMMYNQGLELKEIDKDYMDKSIGKTARKKNEDLILKAKIIFPPMAQFKSKSNSPNNQPPGPASPTDTKKDK